MGGVMDILNSSAIHIREQAKIDAARITQKGRNERAAAEAATAGWAQSYANQQRMKAAGEQYNALTKNIGRNLDDATRGRMMQRLAAAEELGANMVAAAAAGVGGSTVETFNSTLSLHNAMQEEEQDRMLKTAMIDSNAARGDLMVNTVNEFEQGTSLANLDYAQFVDHQKMSGFSKVAGLVGAGVATYFGGPQAGMAVADFVSGQNRAANGDFEGAAARMSSAFQGAMGGWKAYSKGAKPGTFGEAWGKTIMKARNRGAGAKYI